MKKKMIVSLFILLLITVASSTFAWFTYVQRKSLVKLTSHEIEATLYLNDEILSTEMTLDGLSYISFEQEVMMSSSSDGFNEAGLNYLVKLNVSKNSPIIKAMLTLTHNHPELIILWIDEGLYDEGFVPEDDYLSYLKILGDQAIDKAGFIIAINEHNQNVLNHLKTIELKPESTYIMQLVIWADYDMLIDQIDYLERIYQLELSFEMVSGKSDFID